MKMYFIRKNGMYYAHNNCGYTMRAECAEIYDEETANDHVRVSSGEIQKIHIAEVFKDPEKLQPYIDRLIKMKLYLEDNS